MEIWSGGVRVGGSEVMVDVMWIEWRERWRKCNSVIFCIDDGKDSRLEHPLKSRETKLESFPISLW